MVCAEAAFLTPSAIAADISFRFLELSCPSSVESNAFFSILVVLDSLSSSKVFQLSLLFKLVFKFDFSLRDFPLPLLRVFFQLVYQDRLSFLQFLSSQPLSCFRFAPSLLFLQNHYLFHGKNLLLLDKYASIVADVSALLGMDISSISQISPAMS